MFRFITLIFSLVFLCIGLVNASTPAVSTVDASNWANSKGKELLLTLSEKDLNLKYKKLDEMFVNDVNLDFVSRFVIGKYAKLMNKEQKVVYRDLFQRYVLSLYKQLNLNIDTTKVNFTIDSIVEMPKHTNVKCSVNVEQIINDSDTLTVPAKFKLIRGTNNRIQAVDVEIAKVSLVIEYRKRFYQIIKDEAEDINWFLNKFADMVEANESTIRRASDMQSLKK